jgi:hypothetical protein
VSRGEYRAPAVIPGDRSDLAGFPRLIGEICEHMAARGYSPRTIENRRHMLSFLVAWLAERGITRPAEVTRPVLESYQRWLYHYRKSNGQPRPCPAGTPWRCGGQPGRPGCGDGKPAAGRRGPSGAGGGHAAPAADSPLIPGQGRVVTRETPSLAADRAGCRQAGQRAALDRCIGSSADGHGCGTSGGWPVPA